ncbi:hypothetical protein D3C81_2210890 [compost metagenome]
MVAPRPVIFTVNWLVPSEFSDSVIWEVVPWPIDTSAMTEDTPIIIPSIVRKALILLLRILFMAIFIL